MARGKILEIKKYLDIFFVFDMPGRPDDKEIHIISVSPASIERFWGFAKRSLDRLGKTWTDLPSIRIEIGVGEKVGEGIKAFYPMVFALAPAP